LTIPWKKEEDCRQEEVKGRQGKILSSPPGRQSSERRTVYRWEEGKSDFSRGEKSDHRGKGGSLPNPSEKRDARTREEKERRLEKRSCILG